MPWIRGRESETSDVWNRCLHKHYTQQALQCFFLISDVNLEHEVSGQEGNLFNRMYTECDFKKKIMRDSDVIFGNIEYLWVCCMYIMWSYIAVLWVCRAT